MSVKTVQDKYNAALEQLQQAKNQREEIRGKHSYGQAADIELRNAESKLKDAEKALAEMELDLFIARRDEAARLMPNPLASQ